MSSDKIAVISDVHGNRWALEAVLDDIDRRGIVRIVNLGDSLYGPLDPKNTFSLLRARSIVSLRGNEDRILIEGHAGSCRSEICDLVINQLDSEQLAWLKKLRPTAYLQNDILICHAMPGRDDRYLLYDVTPEGVVNRSKTEVMNQLGDRSANLILCGHSHVSRRLRIGDGTIVDVGSVGLQAYIDDIPYRHVMESGDPGARYAILHIYSGQYDVEMCTVAYDWDSAAAAAGNNGFPDWEIWLRTGKAK